MANTMFNLAQGDLGPALVASFKEMQKEWDAALRAVPPVSAAEQPSDELPITRSTYGSLAECEAEQARRDAAHLARQAQAGPVELSEQQVADMLHASDIVHERAHLSLINGDTIHARLSFLTRFANHVLAAQTLGSVPQALVCEAKEGVYGLSNLLRHATTDHAWCAVMERPHLNKAFKAIDALNAQTERACHVGVKVERNRVWIVKGVQSFMLAYEADTDEELNWYAGQLRAALSTITPDVKSVAQEAEQMASAQAAPAASSESVDTPELRELLNNYRKNPNFDTSKQYAALIAHITSLIAARVAGVRKDALEEAAKEADHWQQINTSHKCGNYIADAIRAIAAQSPASSSQEGGAA
jgi:hypothetical protein